MFFNTQIMQDKSITFLANHTKMKLFFVLLFGLFLLLSYLFLMRDSLDFEDANSFRFEIILYVGTPTCMIGSLVLFGNLISKKPFWVLDKQGMYLHTFLGKTMCYEWENIEQIKLVHYHVNRTRLIALVLHLKDEEKNLAQMSKLRRSWAKNTQNIFGSPFAISLMTWKMPISAIIQDINQYIFENNLAKYLIIEAEADDFIIYQSLIKQIFFILFSTLMFFVGGIMCYRVQVQGGIMLFVGGFMMLTFVSQFFDENIRFITSQKQKNKLVQNQKYNKMIGEIGKEEKENL